MRHLSSRHTRWTTIELGVIAILIAASLAACTGLEEGSLSMGATSADEGANKDSPLPCPDKSNGACKTINDGCADCAADGMSLVPHVSAAGCDSDQWCCVPEPTEPNTCEAEGGICVGENDDCPPGWETILVECPSLLEKCCTPMDECL